MLVCVIEPDSKIRPEALVRVFADLNALERHNSTDIAAVQRWICDTTPPPPPTEPVGYWRALDSACVERRFSDTEHVYVVNGRRYDESVTTLVSRLLPPFDEQAHAARIVAQRRYGDVTLDELLLAWSAFGEEAARRGTVLHAYAEYRLRGAPAPDRPLRAAEPFERLWGALRRQCDARAVRTEYCVFNEHTVGTLDALLSVRTLPSESAPLAEQQRAVILIDWKRSKRVDLLKFTMQLNIYWVLLDVVRPESVTACYVGWLHPASGDCQGDAAVLQRQLIRVPDHRREVRRDIFRSG